MPRRSRRPRRDGWRLNGWRLNGWRRDGWRRNRWQALATLIAGSLVVVACSTTIAGRGRPAGVAQPSGPQATAFPSIPVPSFSVPGFPLPTGSGGPTGTAPALPLPSCPTIVDRLAGLEFGCLVTGMEVVPGIPYVTQVLARTETSPDWYMSEFTARRPMSGASLSAVVSTSLTEFLQASYPSGSRLSISKSKTTKVAGRPARSADARVTVDKTAPELAGLQANQDRVVIIAVARTDGSASELILAVPDTQQRLWPRMDAIVAALKLV